MLSLPEAHLLICFQAEIRQMQNQVFKQAVGSREFSTFGPTLDQWVMAALKSGEEWAAGIYESSSQNTDFPFLMVKAVTFDPVYRTAVSKLDQGTATPNDIDLLRDLIKSRETHPSVYAYLSDLLELSQDKNRLSILQQEMLHLTLNYATRREARVHALPDIVAAQGSLYSHVGDIHTHNGTGIESALDLRMSLLLPVIVAVYDHDTVEYRILGSGSFQSSMKSPNNFSEAFQSNQYNKGPPLIHAKKIMYADLTMNTEFDVRSDVGIQSITLLNSGKPIEIIEGRSLKGLSISRTNTPHSDCFFAVDTNGNSYYLGIRKR